MPGPRRFSAPESPDPARQRLTAEERVRLWREDAAVLRRRGSLGYARLLEALASELEADQDAAPSAELVDLGRGAALSGYTRGHLRRMLVEQRLENCGTAGAPLVRVCDLPRKAASVTPAPSAPPVPLRDIALAVACRKE